MYSFVRKGIIYEPKGEITNVLHFTYLIKHTNVGNRLDMIPNKVLAIYYVEREKESTNKLSLSLSLSLSTYI